MAFEEFGINVPVTVQTEQALVALRQFVEQAEGLAAGAQQRIKNTAISGESRSDITKGFDTALFAEATHANAGVVGSLSGGESLAFETDLVRIAETYKARLDLSIRQMLQAVFAQAQVDLFNTDPVFRGDRLTGITAGRQQDADEREAARQNDAALRALANQKLQRDLEQGQAKLIEAQRAGDSPALVQRDALGRFAALDPNAPKPGSLLDTEAQLAAQQRANTATRRLAELKLTQTEEGQQTLLLEAQGKILQGEVNNQLRRLVRQTEVEQQEAAGGPTGGVGAFLHGITNNAKLRVGQGSSIFNNILGGGAEGALGSDGIAALIGGALGGAVGSAGGFLGAQLILGLLTSVQQSIRAAITEALNFEQQMEIVRAVLIDTNQQGQFTAIKQGLLDISDAANVSASALVPLQLQAQGAFGGPKQGLTAVGSAVELAKTSGQSPAQALQELTTVGKAYGLQADEIHRVSDAAFGAFERYGIPVAQTTEALKVLAESAHLSNLELGFTTDLIAKASQISGLAPTQEAERLARFLDQLPTKAADLLRIAQTIPSLAKVLTPQTFNQGTQSVLEALGQGQLTGTQIQTIASTVAGSRGAVAVAPVIESLQEVNAADRTGDAGKNAAAFKLEMESAKEQVGQIEKTLLNIGVELANSGILQIFEGALTIVKLLALTFAGVVRDIENLVGPILRPLLELVHFVESHQGGSHGTGGGLGVGSGDGGGNGLPSIFARVVKKGVLDQLGLGGFGDVTSHPSAAGFAPTPRGLTSEQLAQEQLDALSQSKDFTKFTASGGEQRDEDVINAAKQVGLLSEKRTNDFLAKIKKGDPTGLTEANKLIDETIGKSHPRLTAAFRELREKSLAAQTGNLDSLQTQDIVDQFTLGQLGYAEAMGQEVKRIKSEQDILNTLLDPETRTGVAKQLAAEIAAAEKLFQSERQFDAAEAAVAQANDASGFKITGVQDQIKAALQALQADSQEPDRAKAVIDTLNDAAKLTALQNQFADDLAKAALDYSIALINLRAIRANNPLATLQGAIDTATQQIAFDRANPDQFVSPDAQAAAITTEEGKRTQAQQQIDTKNREDRLNLLKARRNLGVVQSGNDPLAAAQAAKDIAAAEVINARQETGVTDLQRQIDATNALADQIKADQQVTDALRGIGDAKFNLLEAIARSTGDDVEVARLELEKAKSALSGDLASGAREGSAKILSDQAAVKNAETELANTRLSTAEATFKFEYDMGQISRNALIADLKGLVATTTDVKLRQQLLLEIHNLAKEAGSNLQFNLPTDFNLPTLYEARRLNDGPGTYGGNVDNRVQHFQFYGSDATLDQIKKTVAEAAGATSQIYGTYAKRT